jgi:hypothetical protein
MKGSPEKSSIIQPDNTRKITTNNPILSLYATVSPVGVALSRRTSSPRVDPMESAVADINRRRTTVAVLWKLEAAGILVIAAAIKETSAILIIGIMLLLWLIEDSTFYNV